MKRVNMALCAVISVLLFGSLPFLTVPGDSAAYVPSFAAQDVKKTAHIPEDWYGAMGVPITFSRQIQPGPV